VNADRARALILWTDGVSGAADLHGPEQLQRRMLFLAVTLMSGVCGMWSAVYIAMGLPILGMLCGGLGLICLGAIGTTRSHPTTTREIVLAASVGLLWYVGLLMDGIGGPMTIWLPTIPLLTLSVGGVRTAARWTAITLVVPVSWYIAQRYGLVSFVMPIEQNLLAVAQSASAMSFGFGLVAVQHSAHTTTHETLREEVTTRTAAEREAVDARQAQSRFLAVMSHEIRTPLNGVLGLIELLLDTKPDEQQRRYLTVAQSSGRGLSVLLNDLMDFAKIGADRLTLERTGFSVKETCIEVVGVCTPIAEKKGVAVRCEIAESLPDHVLGDPARMRQSVLNLVGNAVKFTAHGEVVVSVTWQDDLLEIAVRDTGIGMTEESLQVVFDPFVQADASTTRRHGGSGLGLALTRKLVTAMSGTVSVQSTLGVGTRFVISVRAERAERAVEPTDDSARVAHTGLILVVDDEPINRMVARGLIARLGFTVDEATNGQEALLAVAERRPALVLMDCFMPVMDGFDATRAIRERFPDLPVVGLSASARPEDVQKGLEAGMSGYLRKPINVAELEQMLADMAGKNQADGKQAAAS